MTTPPFNAVTMGAVAGDPSRTPNIGLLQKAAATPAAGTALINGTQTIFTWVAPNDGVPHRVTLFGCLSVTSAQTGGALQLSYTSPDNRGAASAVWGGGFGNGVFQPNLQTAVMVAPGSTVTFAQNAAQTAGASTVFAELWAL